MSVCVCVISKDLFCICVCNFPLFKLFFVSCICSENAQNASICSGTVVHGRRFQHANAQISLVKTAAQR